MGRFGDLWKSGKVIRQDQKLEAARRAEEAMKLMQELNPDIETASASDQILAALKSRRGQETGRWLRDMAGSGGFKPQEAAQEAVSTSGGFQATVAWVNALFKEFGELAFEFNKTAVGTDLMLTCETPTLREKKDDSNWYRPVVKSYIGRLTTRLWALLVKGTDGKIFITILPATMVLAYTAEEISENDYPPLMQVVRESVDGNQVWTIGGETAPLESIPHLAKEVLGDLIRVSSGVMSESELFSHASSAPKLGENLAVGFQNRKSETASEALARKHAPDFDDMNVFDACDVVDGIVDRELKKLYAEASKIQPGSPMAAVARKQISAMEAFRSKMLNAFEEFTREAHALQEGESVPEPVGVPDLLS